MVDLLIQNFSVHEIILEKENGVHKIKGIKVALGKKSGNDELSFTSSVTIGAGGYNCPVSRVITELHNEPHRDDEHFCGGYREYWDNVGGLGGKEGPIEIHFIGRGIALLFLAISVQGNRVNVGIGMLISEHRKLKKSRKNR